MAQIHKILGVAPDDRDEAVTRVCEYPDCQVEGIYRAPRDRDGQAHYWFCLDHVRAYNKAWNFFEGMSEDEILAYQREDVTGHRPTWRFGISSEELGANAQTDAFGLFRDAWSREGGGKKSRRQELRDPELNRALDIMNLEHPIDRGTIKTRYKELVKRHHPDANGGDKKAEERLKLINEAYSYLMSGNSL